MPNAVYNSFKKRLLEAGINFVSDTIKCALVTSSYTPNIDTHEYFSHVTNEVSGGGYSAGGATLANKSVSQDNADNEGVFDANDVSWTNSTLTARAAVLYKSTGVSATSPLIAYIDFGENKSSSDSTFLIEWSAEGILNLS